MDKDLMEELGLMATDSQLDYIDTLLDQAGVLRMTPYIYRSWKTLSQRLKAM